MEGSRHIVVPRDDGYHVAFWNAKAKTLTGVMCCSDEGVAERKCACLDDDNERLKRSWEQQEIEIAFKRIPQGFYSDNEG